MPVSGLPSPGRCDDAIYREGRHFPYRPGHASSVVYLDVIDCAQVGRWWMRRPQKQVKSEPSIRGLCGPKPRGTKIRPVQVSSFRSASWSSPRWPASPARIYILAPSSTHQNMLFGQWTRQLGGETCFPKLRPDGRGLDRNRHAVPRIEEVGAWRCKRQVVS